MPLLETRGAASAKGFGLTASTTAANYIEDVFSTTLYAGTNSYRAVDVGVADLATKGALFWAKGRNTATFTENHKLYDTARAGAGGGGTLTCNPSLSTNDSALNNSGTSVTFNPTGTSLILNGSGEPNNSSVNYVGWTFRKQPKFFDVVTYTGNGTAGRTVAHNLGSVPGCIIVKQTSASGQGWPVYHRSEGNGRALLLNDTAASFLASGYWNTTTPTSTEFTLGSSAAVNESGQTYVAYLFAHDAGGFGLTGTDNVISCGSFTVSGNAATVNLGYEPQWLLIKSAASVSAWDLFDSMRGLQVSGNQPVLNAQSSGAEFGTGSGVGVNVTSTGFATNGYLGNGNHIYIAIRRGPMKTPTTGTSVFSPVVYTGNGSTNTVTSGFPVDLSITKYKSSNGPRITVIDRLRGFGTATDATKYLFTSATDAEGGASDGVTGMGNTGLTLSSWSQTNFSSADYIDWMFQRAPGFFDVVCYTGNGVDNSSWTHNLGVTPELIIVKSRSSSYGWPVYNATDGYTYSMYLNTTAARTTSNQAWYAPTSSVFKTTDLLAVNGSGTTYVAYLFATVSGVSKVGSYTGTGNTLQINCGFTGGARFVLIKRTDSTGDWYVWDSARGIVAGNDPYLLLNSTAAEVTNTDYVDTYSAGFEISSTAPAAINANGGTYIFLAIA